MITLFGDREGDSRGGKGEATAMAKGEGEKIEGRAELDYQSKIKKEVVEGEVAIAVKSKNEEAEVGWGLWGLITSWRSKRRWLRWQGRGKP